MIYDSCQFAAQGLTLLCEHHVGWQIRGTAHTFSQLMKLLLENRIDMVLCGIGNRRDGFSRLLNLPDYVLGRSILLTDKPSEILKKTFLTAGFDAVISKQISLDELADVMTGTMYSKKKHAIFPHLPSRIYLSDEREVLSELLKGRKLYDIANDMGISYRTVSRYKQNALRRAGLRSINEILLRQKNYLPLELLGLTPSLSRKSQQK